MARPQKNGPPDQFTGTELSVGAGLPSRLFGLLVERGLAPRPRDLPFTGKQTPRFYDEDALKHTALIGALHGGGIELLPAARLAALFESDMGAAYGHLLSNFETYIRSRDFNPTPGYYPWEVHPDDDKLGGDISDDFWLHHLLRTRSSTYKRGVALRSDTRLEIADRQYVFLSFGVVKTSSPFTDERHDATAEYRIVGWERGADGVQVRSLHEEVGGDWSDDDEARARGAAIEAEFQAARLNAVSLLRVNVSLAIRNAFDAIHDYREANGATFDWTKTVKSPPGRYAGCDENGMPLDPNHIWNQGLPPLERAKRLVEIEEYIARREAERLKK